MFPFKNSASKRPDSEDPVILMTDGATPGQSGTPEKTMEEAQTLKDKNTTLTILAMGLTEASSKTMRRSGTSPEHVFDAEFDEVDKILDKLFHASCSEPGMGIC